MKETVHATALAFGEAGLLLRGAPGAGKSALALALLGLAARSGRFARLVADDRVLLTAAGGRVVARAPAAIKGLIEMRSAGILPARAIDAVRISLVVDLAPAAAVARYPEPEETTARLEGVDLPRIVFAERSAAVTAVSLAALLAGDGLTGSGSRSQRRPVAASALDDPSGAPAEEPGVCL